MREMMEGRLTGVGFATQGNEFSTYMLLASHFILNQYVPLCLFASSLAPPPRLPLFRPPSFSPPFSFPLSFFPSPLASLSYFPPSSSPLCASLLQR